MKAASGNRSARRYAKAVYLLAREKREESLWSQEMEKADSLLSRTEVSEILSHPKLGIVEKWKMIEGLLSGQGLSLRKEMLNFLKLLLQNQKIHLLSGVREEFQALWESQQGLLSIRVTTAVALNPQEKEALRLKLVANMKKEVRLEETVDPEILGGAILQIGDRIVDGSLRTKLLQMRESMVA